MFFSLLFLGAFVAFFRRIMEFSLRKSACKIGPRGPRGADGKKGDAGKTGNHGERGYQGERGDRGEKGDPGERGESGGKADIPSLTLHASTFFELEADYDHTSLITHNSGVFP